MASGNSVVSAMALAAALKTNDATNLAAINAAIDASWPMWRMTEHASGGTLASTTYEYSLTALTTVFRDTGVAVVTVTPTGSYPRDISNRCRQYYDHSATAWTLVIDPGIVAKYSGYTFYVDYQYPHPQIALLTDTVYAPVRALAASALLWRAMQEGSNTNLDNAFWRAFAPEHLRSPSAVWESAKSQHLQHKVRL